MDIKKVNLGFKDAIVGCIFICGLVGVFYKSKTDVELIKAEVRRNSVQLSKDETHNREEFKLIHLELKLIIKNQYEGNQEILEKIDQKHSK